MVFFTYALSAPRRNSVRAGQVDGVWLLAGASQRLRTERCADLPSSTPSSRACTYLIASTATRSLARDACALLDGKLSSDASFLGSAPVQGGRVVTQGESRGAGGVGDTVLWSVGAATIPTASAVTSAAGAASGSPPFVNGVCVCVCVCVSV